MSSHSFANDVTSRGSGRTSHHRPHQATASTATVVTLVRSATAKVQKRQLVKQSKTCWESCFDFLRFTIGISVSYGQATVGLILQSYCSNICISPAAIKGHVQDYVGWIRMTFVSCFLPVLFLDNCIYSIVNQVCKTMWGSLIFFLPKICWHLTTPNWSFLLIFFDFFFHSHTLHLH